MLTKQAIDISFAQGVDTKTDPKRVPVGKFLARQNTVFNKGGLLQKRDGYNQLTSLPATTYSFLTTFNGNLTAVGSNIAAYNNGDDAWVQKGSIQPLSLRTLPVLRNNLNQSACDIAVASNGLACAVYLEVNAGVTVNKYVVFDSVTGQNITAPAVIPVVSGTVSGGMRVFVLGNYFVMMFTNNATTLQYIAVSIANPSSYTANADISAAYIAKTTLSWDAYVVGENLYIAYNTTTGGQAIKVTYLSATSAASGGAPATAVSFSNIATMISVTADVSTPAVPVIYVSFYDLAGATGYTLAVDQSLITKMTATQTITTGTILNLTSSAQNGICTIYYEVSNSYSLIPGTGTPTNYVSARTITLPATVTTGTLGTAYIVIRSVGLASKSFIIGGVIYFLSVYQSSYQVSYFLINGSSSVQAAPVIAAKLAYQNGGGYLTVGLPSVTVTGTVAQIGYRFKDLIQAVNKNTAVITGTQTVGIYSQTGINMVTMTIGSENLDTAEIGSDLHLTGGFLWMYDGYLPVEHNFFIYPDVAPQAPPNPTNASVADWTASSVVTPTGTFSSGSTSVVVSSATGISVGMTITDTSNAYIPANTYITAISGTTLTISNATTNSAAGDNLSIQGNIVAKPDGSTTTNAYFYQITYEWTDNQGNAFRSAPSIPIALTTSGAASTGSITLKIPTLRLTMKTANPVKIVIYRWSVGQQNYYQVTTITNPLLNSTTVDSVTFVDPYSDAYILGNNLLYTTGGVIEDVNAPASDLLSLFDTRIWLVNAEDRNVLWFSKQCIEATPVEMSDLLTMFIPPTVATATGEITSIFPMDDKLIISKGGNSFVYINGNGPDNTGANNQYSEPIFITSTVGSSNQRSFALIPQGTMFQSNKGIWLLGRDLQTSYIGAAVEDFTQGAIVTSATTIPETNQVRFTLDTGITLMYDYYYDQWDVSTRISAVSSCVFENVHTYIDDDGAVFQEAENHYLDGTNPVLQMFRTGWIRLGDLANYQRAYFFYLLGSFISPHKLQVDIYYDYEDNPTQTIIISPDNYSTPYGSGSSQNPYGQGTPYGGHGRLENWRVFLARQRCMALSIKVQELFDPTYGTVAGAGFTLSGINMVMGFKKGWRTQPAAQTVG